ncbi:SAM-dependent methyltransferase TehB [Erwinia sp. 9145]|uniref:SAM-dependent methyltransferase TehB n=1 Tax=Erwinia sp. 9145 TaxID=1500895 RepID=UPI000555C56A|nr:SAM-dependent methyltransferase TehB [Erwinia sp. 9145]
MTELICYKTLPIWHADTLPDAFKQQHNTREGVRAQLTVLKGTVNFSLLTANGQVTDSFIFTPENQPPRILPQQWHRIDSVSSDVACQLAFYCRPEEYYHHKYSLTAPHSEVIEAARLIPPGRVLDLGCGNGRNVLYLNQRGFRVEGWDKSADSLRHLQSIMAAEKLANVTLAQRDLNQVTLEGRYDFILSTVVMMFLQPETPTPLIEQMQRATADGGYNLIVAAMDTPDYPCVMPFPFTFKPGELRAKYNGWKIIKYNENPGALHKVDAQGNRIKMRFATLLAQKVQMQAIQSVG